MTEKIHMIIARRRTEVAFFFSNTTRPRSANALVYTGTTKVACGSNIQYRWKSYAASVSSDGPNTNKVGKKVSKDVRRAIVESFVNNYREKNAGKFPSVSDARKQIGGGHYALRQIIQELEYKSKTSPLTNGSENLSRKQLIEEDESLTEVEEISGSKITVGAEVQNDLKTSSINEVPIGNDSSKHLEGELQSSASAEKSLPKEPVQTSTQDDHLGFRATKSEAVEVGAKAVSSHILENPGDDQKVEAQGSSGLVGAESILKGEIQGHHSKDLEYPKEQNIPEDVKGLDETKSKAVSEPEKYAVDSSRRQSDAQLPKKTSVWGNLKSFADSFASIWRKK